MRPLLRVTPSFVRTATLLSIFAASLLGACGGKQLSTMDGSGSGGGGASGGSGGSGGIANLPDGGACVNLASFDQSCDRTSDCVQVNGISSNGDAPVCDGYYPQCPGGGINKSALASYMAALSELTPYSGYYDCPANAAPKCQDHVCCTPDFVTGECTLSDAGRGGEAGTGSSDAGACVDIDLADYDQSCVKASDCTIIQSGEVCSGSCNCGDSSINQSGLAEYEKATAGIAPSSCPCAEAMPECVHGKCALPSGG
jgi:hypothetical protein